MQSLALEVITNIKIIATRNFLVHFFWSKFKNTFTDNFKGYNCFVITKKRSLINRTEIPLVACRFDEIDCDKNAFRHFKLSIFHHGLSDCYTFNGGRNLNEEPEELRYQKLRGFMAGLRVFF